MRFTRRHPLLAALLLCALAVLAARPTDGDGHAPGHGSASGVSAEVARLYEEAAEATERYEAARHEAGKQRARAQRLEARLDRERQAMAGCARTWAGSPAPSTGTAAGCRSRRT
jgi:hypothetical protein